MKWRTDFDKIPKGYFLVSYKNKGCLGYRNTVRCKEVSIFNVRIHEWSYRNFYDEIDAWMPMPEGYKK